RHGGNSKANFSRLGIRSANPFVCTSGPTFGGILDVRGEMGWIADALANFPVPSSTSFLPTGRV
ncbi:MAG: hypothetical protein OEM41_07150, partial [Ignavibacteria bacterium]|nr:hypothetical protein [Ignavibacteria bacterium]